MQRRLDKYKEIQQIRNIDSRKKRERIFLEEQRIIIERFIANEEHSRI